MEKKNRLTEFFKTHKTALQFVVFTAFSAVAFLSQLLVQFLLDVTLQNLTASVEIWPFAAQPLGSFIAFLAANVTAKVLSYVLNRKKTFNANNSLAKSASIYVVMVVTLIIVETVVGAPLGAAIYKLFGGAFSGSTENAQTALNLSLYRASHTLSIMVYSFFDGIIVFLMDKFVIMRRTPTNNADETK